MAGRKHSGHVNYYIIIQIIKDATELILQLLLEIHKIM